MNWPNAIAVFLALVAGVIALAAMGSGEDEDFAPFIVATLVCCGSLAFLVGWNT